MVTVFLMTFLFLPFRHFRQEDYNKWSAGSCCSNDYPTTHLSCGGGESESISMQQYHSMHHPNCTSPLMALPSPGTLQRNSQGHHSMTQSVQYHGGEICGGGGGTLKRVQVQIPMSIPDCVQ